MLKINLSDEKNKKKDTVNETVNETVDENIEETANETVDEIDEEFDDQPVMDTAAQSILDEPEEETPRKKSLSISPRYLIVVLFIALIVLVYLNRGIIKDKIPIPSFLSGESKTVVQTEAPVPPPPPAPQPVETEAAPAEPDPTFVALNSISKAVVPKVWLSSVVVKYDGSYEIRGVSFSHEAIKTMMTSLQGIGDVKSFNIPKKSKSANTVYQFALSGVLNDIKVPEILDTIPTDNLVSLSDIMKQHVKEYGIKILHSPKSGQTYSDKVLPFVLEGSFDGLKKVIGDICPEGGDSRIFRLVITPSSPGKSFDKIRASFHLKTVSSI